MGGCHRCRPRHGRRLAVGLVTAESRHILIGICGGIAAYKLAAVVSAVVQRGDRVTVAMTASAQRFIGPATLEALSGRPVLTEPWTVFNDPTSQHIALGRDADAMLVAPCTMNTAANLAQGRTDDAVTLLAASIDRDATPVLVAPSMNATMYAQPALQRNLAVLARDGLKILAPDSGWQACRTDGAGRLPEPAALIDAIDAAVRATSDV